MYKGVFSFFVLPINNRKVIFTAIEEELHWEGNSRNEHIKICEH